MESSGGVTVGEGDQTALFVGLLRQSLQQNQQMMQQNQQLVATMLRRMDLEEKRRNKAEEKVAETAKAAKKAAEAALTRDPFDPRAAPRALTLVTRFLVVVLVVPTVQRSICHRFPSLTIM